MLPKISSYLSLAVLGRYVVVAAVTIITFGHARSAHAATCKIALQRTALSFAAIDSQIDVEVARGNRTGFRKNVWGPETVRRFYKKAWPAIQTMIEESGVTVYDLMQEYEVLADLVLTESGLYSPEILASFRAARARVNKQILEVEKFPADKKLKRFHWMQIQAVMLGLEDIGLIAYMIEKGSRSAPTFNPLLEITVKQFETILDSVAASDLDKAAEAVRVTRAQRAARRMMNLQSPTEEPAAPPVETVVSPENVTLDTNLAIALSLNQPLSSDFLYDARTSFGMDLKVQLSPELVEDSRGPESENIHKLLGSVITGRGNSSGIKTLFDIGPKIIELKAILHGH